MSKTELDINATEEPANTARGKLHKPHSVTEVSEKLDIFHMSPRQLQPLNSMQDASTGIPVNRESSPYIFEVTTHIYASSPVISTSNMEKVRRSLMSDSQHVSH